MNNMHKIAITGASGYIGNYLSHFLQNKNYLIYEMSRNKNGSNFIPFQLAGNNDYSLLKNMDVLIHCAHDFSPKNYQGNQKINLDGTLDLFINAKKQGVKKLIFISSLSAFEGALSDYGRLKYEIEKKIQPYNPIIIRPGLVYSDDEKGSAGNFIRKSKIVPVVNLKIKTFHPCHLEDLANLIEKSIYFTPDNMNIPIVAASNQILTFKEFIIKLAKFNKKKIFLLPLPYNLLLFCLKTLEYLKINIGIRSDSLINMKSYNEDIDFNIAKIIGVNFRSFN